MIICPFQPLEWKYFVKFPFSYSLKYLQNSIYAVYTFLPHLLRKRFHPKSGRFYAHLRVLGCLQISKFSKFALSLSLILVYQQIIRWYSNNSHFFQQTLYYTREHWTMPFAPPALRAVLRRQRQRDATLWTPIPRCCGECVRLSPLMRAAPSRQQDGGTKGWQIPLSVSIYKLGK